MSAASVLQADSTEERAENARLSAFVGAIAIGDLVKSTLGPKGMDKILHSVSGREMQVTNDGATILKSIQVDNPAAKVLINLSKVQDEEVGDGTTSVCVLACELLREAEKLIGCGVHPQVIIAGYREGCEAARLALEASAINLTNNPELLKQALLGIARTTISSKILSSDREHFAQLAVDAVLRLGGSTDLERIQIIKKTGGSLVDSYLDDGFILDKTIGANQPRRVENARIIIANTPMDTDKVKVFGSRFKVTSPQQMAILERAEKDKMREKVEAIKSWNPTCFINRQLIYNWPEQLLAESGIMTIEHADFDGVERLALVTGAQIASTFDRSQGDAQTEKGQGKAKSECEQEDFGVVLGHADLIEEIMIGEDRLIKFSGCKAASACTVVLRGATQQLLEEAERSLHDAFCILSQTVGEPKTVLGGGCSEMLMARAVESRLPAFQGKQMLAVEAFSRALRQLPTILADNAGYDSGELVARLRAMHAQGFKTAGLDMYAGSVGDMVELGVVEALKLKRQVLMSASEAAEMILRVDDIIKAAPRQRSQHH